MRQREDNGPFNVFAETDVCVEFFQLDPMRIVWHGNYFNFFESGRRALLEKIEFGYDAMEKSGFAFPVVDARAKYINPLRFRDMSRIKAILIEYENCLRIKYEIRDIKTGVLATKGVTTQMAVNVMANESSLVCPRILIESVEALIKKMRDEQ
jgi:acyl-CoA thioester hydrolase